MLDEVERKLLNELNDNLNSIEIDVEILKLNYYNLLNLVSNLSSKLDNIENRGYE